MHTMVKVSRVNVIASQLAELLESAFVSSLTLLECIEPSLDDVRGISHQLLVDFLVAHKSVMKLDYVLARIFPNLFHHGFCRTNAENKDEEGEGKKDVRDEFEDEEQLLGLPRNRQEEPEQPSEQKAEDTGLEMQDDFEGTMHDMPDDEEGKQN
ncbi:hypothetical protein PsorP6_010436 [Peronosclerospora sorghi]|uniref:Uncharacterized protein n=1 Tax=Peronosclerospora sorghi TaxID=230839 RepID=A0ACC0VWB0_9STRA|nr:hypothetical protein PsorP6_010436 [Peronosclerospora sorghi]